MRVRVGAVALAANLCLPLTLGQQVAAQKPSALQPDVNRHTPVAPAPEIERLNRLFSGNWTIREKFEPTPFWPQGGSGHGTKVYRSGPGGHSLIADSTSKGPLGPFSTHSVITWDASQQLYKLYWFNSLSPEGRILTGQWEGDDLVFTSQKQHDHKLVETRHTFSHPNNTSFKFWVERSIDKGPWQRIVTIDYTREKAPEPANK